MNLLSVPPSLLADPRLSPLRARAHEIDAETLNDQLELVAIPAPPFGEDARAERLAERFREIGLAGVRRDAEGNVLGHVSGTADSRPIVIAAHLDTVFAAGTDVTPRHRDGRIHAPGITDNGRGLAGMLAVARVIAASEVRTVRPLVFVGSVGEEGAGDLRGVKHLFRAEGELRDAAGFIALDGSGLRRIVHRAIGSRRLRVEVRGPGGHSWADRGAPNPVAVLGSVIAQLSMQIWPEPTKTALTVARIGGGTSINAIPDCGWMEVDMRSEAPGVLPRMEETVRAILSRVVEQQNAARRQGSGVLMPSVRVIGDRPSGITQPREALVQAATNITWGLGQKPELVGSSTDANVPMALGIPSIAIGVGGDSGGIHTPDEWYANEHGALGVERALLIVLAAAGVAQS